LKKTWTDLIILNGRPRHPQTQGLVERGNQTLESALGKWMQSNNRKDWSKGKQINRLIIISERLLNLGLAQVVYSINTSSAQTTKKSPYELVFGQKARPDTQMWQLLSGQGVLDEEELPRDFIDQLNECEDLTSVVEDATSADANQPSISQAQLLQTAPPSPSIVHASPRTKKRRRARLFSNDQITSISKGKTTRYTFPRKNFRSSFL